MPTTLDNKRRLASELILRTEWGLPAGYLPAAITKLDDKALIALASNQELREAFEESERRRIANDWPAFLAGYVSHSPGEGTGRAALEPWEWQIELAEVIGEGQPLIVLKRRQVGVSLLISAYAVWNAGLKDGTNTARVLIISKEGRSAKRVLKECRKQIQHLPNYLRPEAGEKATSLVTGQPCQDSTEELEFNRGASIASFPPTAGGRGETASVAIVDEAAVFEGSADPDETISAVLPAADHGQLILVSTGNGRGVKGKKFADLWDAATSAELPWETFFIDRTMHPDWSDEWARKTLLAMGEHKFKREYPENAADALDGDSEGKAYDRQGVMAAIGLSDQAVEAKGEALYLGIDYGGVPSAVVMRRVRRMGLEILGEYVAEGPSPDPDEFILRAIELAGEYGQLETIYFDSADKNVIVPTVRRLAPQLRTHAVVFSQSKKQLVGFLRHLLARTSAGEDYGFISIGECENLRRQLLNIEQDLEGRPQKGDDHAHDALLCALREPYAIWQRTHQAD